MKLKYWGTAYEKGLTLTADLYDTDGTAVHTGFPMTETVAGSSAIYSTANILSTVSLDAGIYVVRIINANGDFLGHEEVIFNGIKEVTLLELRFFTPTELMQLRDALGIDGDKLLAKNGQLQMKGEGPYNEVVNTKNI